MADDDTETNSSSESVALSNTSDAHHFQDFDPVLPKITDVLHGGPPYLPLVSPRWIRLLYLLPGSFDSEIQGFLIQVCLDSNVKYEALSYVWGDPTKTIPITLADEPFPVTVTLEAALRHLRDGEAARILWIDALCINQADIPERNQQVANMGTIYEKAANVVVWLGPDAEEYDLWSGSRERTEKAFNYAGVMTRLDQMVSEDPTLQINDIAWHDGFPDADNGTRAFMNLMCRRWFTRLWVVQEVGLAKGNIVVYCGTEYIPWEWLRITASNMLLNKGLYPPLVQAYCSATKLGNIAVMSTFPVFREESINVGGNLARLLARLLYTTAGTFNQSDCRDRLYALLGFIKDHAPTHPALQVDYALSPSSVFTALARYLIEELGSLDLLSAAVDQDVTGLPSWVPSWSQVPSHSGSLLDKGFLAEKSVDAKAAVTFSEDSRLLYTKGVVLGQVKLVGDKCPRWAASGHLRLKELFNKWENNILGSPFIKHKYESSETAMHMWKSTLLHKMDQVDDFEDSSGHYSLRNRWNRRNHELYDIFMGRTEWPGGLSKPAEDRRKDELVFALEQSQTLQDHCPFITSEGDVGVTEASFELREDDVLCLLQGGSVPFALRRDGEFYRLVGVCYMYEYRDAHVQQGILSQKSNEDFILS